MSQEWYYSLDGKQQGPVSTAELKELAEKGELKVNQLVWKEGMASWIPAERVKGLMSTDKASVGPPPLTAGTTRRVSHARGHRSVLWSILLLVGAFLNIAAFVLPWWGLTYTPPTISTLTRPPRPPRPPTISELTSLEMDGTKGRNTSSASAEIEALDAMQFVSASIGNRAFQRLQIVIGSKEAATLRVWGWSTGTAIFGLVVAVLVIAVIIASFFVNIVESWSWIGSFLWSVAALVLLILALVWIFGSPSLSTDVLSAGISFGPFVTLAAAFIVLPFGIVDGILGLRVLIASVKAKRVAVV